MVEHGLSSRFTIILRAKQHWKFQFSETEEIELNHLGFQILENPPVFLKAHMIYDRKYPRDRKLSQSVPPFHLPGEHVSDPK